MTVEKATQNVRQAVIKLKSIIASGNFPNNYELLELCREYGINLIKTKNEQHRVHDLLETAINLFLFEKYSNEAEKNKFAILAELEDFQQKLSTQTWRDGEQIIYQQFSTPPALGFVMSQFIRPEKNSTLLEPSAGTGSLANWLKINGRRAKVNEISARRRELLEIQGYKPLAVNAEFLDDLLDPGIKPDFILMNPPFSSSGGRAKNRDSSFGFRHVESALSRLNIGGRLVCLLGAKSCLETDKGKSFWRMMGCEYKVRLFLVVPAKTYYKYGTTFQTVIVVIDKPALNQPPGIQNSAEPQTIEFCSLKEMLQFSQIFNSTNF